METVNNQFKRWILPRPINDDEIHKFDLNVTLQKVLIRRGLDLDNELDEYISPSELPNPEDHFNELSKATKRIIHACNRNEKIAICGDYDADGITSTVLLVELLSTLGANVNSYIPSRQEEGYGLNLNMIDRIYNNKVKLVITVDNGISASDSIKRSNELGMDLIITDHHKIPDKRFDIFSLIHPERTPINSPYKHLAGVGIAYLLAKNICNKLNYDINNTSANVLFCIGTIADMAPLKGANRKWLKEYLPNIKSTNNIGIRSIINKLSIDNFDITAEDIGYRIAPLINAVGRIGDPNLIVDLFTNKSQESVNKITKECFALNRERKRITTLIQHEAFEIAISEYKTNRKFLVLAKREWHLGVIGIVAARIVDNFNLPTALLAEAKDGIFRGSIRSNNKLNVKLALDECKDLLVSYGGHSSAAGFSVKDKNISYLRERLDNIARREFKDIDLNKSIKPDAYLSLGEINHELYKQICLIGPFGMMNPAPVFWTRGCKILDIFKLKGDHFRMILDDGTSSIAAIKWNGLFKFKRNDLVDIAYCIEINKWNKKNNLQINLIDIKKHQHISDIILHRHVYKCQLIENEEILVTNKKGQCFSSDLSISTDNLNEKQKIFAKKILTYAEVALGIAA